MTIHVGSAPQRNLAGKFGAVRIGQWSKQSARADLEALDIARGRTDVARRMCLGCDRKFWSGSKANRLCTKCKAKQAYEASTPERTKQHSWRR